MYKKFSFDMMKFAGGDGLTQQVKSIKLNKYQKFIPAHWKMQPEYTFESQYNNAHIHYKQKCASNEDWKWNKDCCCCT